MDSDYLKRSIGGPLSDALVAMVVAQPEDSVQFLGEALLDYVRRAEDANKRQAYAAKLQIKLEDAQREEAAAAKVGKPHYICWFWHKALSRPALQCDSCPDTTLSVSPFV
jgi:Dpy-30 motif